MPTTGVDEGAAPTTPSSVSETNAPSDAAAASDDMTTVALTDQGRTPAVGAKREAAVDVAPRVLDVVAGIVFDSSRTRVLLALRKPEQHQGNRWEFPGGKVEPGEALDAALARELEEEIGIVPSAAVHRRTLEHAYPEKTVRLHFLDVTAFEGEPAGREGQTLRWVALEGLAELDFPDANRAVVAELAGSVGGGLSG